MKIVVIAPLPPPVTGQSLAVQTLVESLLGSEDVKVIDSTKKGFQQGISSFSRLQDIAGILMTVWRFRRSADVIYFNVSQSIAGNLKDLLIYAICCNRLNKMVIHLHGGAGMCDDFPLAYSYTNARTLRFADGPDEVHRNAIAKAELGKYSPQPNPA